MITAEQALKVLRSLEITHVVWVPDSYLGRWEAAIEQSPTRLIRVCREGEAWPLAAGLYAGGSRPLVMMQTTGLFESGDALRNAAYDLRAPLYAWIGVRNWLIPDSTDSARRFAPAIIEAWGLDHVWIECGAEIAKLVDHFRQCQAAGRAGMALLAEGAG
jgi:sulfopyruvate decarboxylase TPP-binding subunit